MLQQFEDTSSARSAQPGENAWKTQQNTEGRRQGAGKHGLTTSADLDTLPIRFQLEMKPAEELGDVDISNTRVRL